MMRKPYYRVSARCTNSKCQQGFFAVERKQIVKTGTSGQQYTIERVVCPNCRQWQHITEIAKVE